MNSERIAVSIATWFGCGYASRAPGTAGSLGALPFAFVLQFFSGNLVLFVAAVLLFFIGWWASDIYLGEERQEEDPSEIVVDEVVGMWLLLAFLYPTWQSYLAAFLLFRLFDIVKPWPVSLADKQVKGAFGVMLDDATAALYPVVVYAGFWMAMYVPDKPFALQPLMDFLMGSYVQ